MLLPEHEKFHKLGPNEVGLDPTKTAAMTVQVLRQTSMTGEQITVDIPIYADDSRELLRDRLGMAYSLLQERLEEENKAVLQKNEEAKQRREAELAAQAEEKKRLAEEKRQAKAAKKGK